jgi:hypothetical protein
MWPNGTSMRDRESDMASVAETCRPVSIGSGLVVARWKARGDASHERRDAKLILEMSVSIDRFVGRPNGENRWLFRSMDDQATAWTVEFLRGCAHHGQSDVPRHGGLLAVVDGATSSRGSGRR